MSEWIIGAENGKTRKAPSRAEAESIKADMEDLGLEVEIQPPAGAAAEHDDGITVVDEEQRELSEVEDASDTDAYTLPDRHVGEDPMKWVPDDFIDQIDGTPAINRKGFEVLSHFYDISVYAEIDVPPEDTDFGFCRVKATAVMPDGRECEAYGSAHTDRGDTPALLLEMADTRARKRALSIATGVGAVAVEELRNEIDASA